jgi:hypothetical protein
MSIYTPYFYVIQDIRNGMYYAGAKWGKDANPDNFMVEGGYQTSSETIKELIHQCGLSNFIICKIRMFVTGAGAYEYEKRFLQKVDAKNNPRFYNKHNNDLFVFHDNDYKVTMKQKYGVEHPLYSDEIKEKMKKTNLKRYGDENVLGRKGNIRSVVDAKIFEKYRVHNISQLTETQEKIRQTSLTKRGVEHHLSDTSVIEKSRNTKKERYNDENFNNRELSRLTKLKRYGDGNYTNIEKAKETNVERYGFEYVSQVPYIAEKMSHSIKKTKQSKEWKETKGIEARKKLSETLNSEEWKETKGKEKSEKLSKIKSGKGIGKENPNYGNFWTDRQKEELSKKHSGKNHPQFGWIWITNGIESRKINPQIEEIPVGWNKGRKITKQNDLPRTKRQKHQV